METTQSNKAESTSPVNQQAATTQLKKDIKNQTIVVLGVPEKNWNPNEVRRLVKDFDRQAGKLRGKAVINERDIEASLLTGARADVGIVGDQPQALDLGRSRFGGARGQNRDE